MENFVEWLKINYPEFLNEQDNSVKPWITSPVYKPIPKQTPSTIAPPAASLPANHPENEYKADEIIIKKQIIPKDFIRAAQTNPEKWDRDFQNLQKPGTMPSKYHTGSQWKDIGFATHKDFLDKPITIYVVTDEALKRLYPYAGAYASSRGDYIVMPKNSFTELPTATSDGKLTKDGAETLAHELRHTTQKGIIPQERLQDPNLPGKYTDLTSPISKRYFKDPREMGVRLAAIKNLLDENLRQKIKKEITVNLNLENLEFYKNLTARVPLDDYLDEGIIDNNDIILNTEKWVDTAYNEIKKKLNSNQYYTPNNVKFIKNYIIDSNPEIEKSKKDSMLIRAKQRKDQYLFKQETRKLQDIDPKNEKDMLIFILDPIMYLNSKIKNNSYLYYGGNYKKIQEEFRKIGNKIKEEITGSAEGIISSLGLSSTGKNHDVSSLIKFYDSLDPEEKKNYLDELLRVYDQVVKNNPQNNQSAYG